LEKITTRVRESTIEEQNKETGGQGSGDKLAKTDRVRADTTLVPANVVYPSDAGLLARAWPE
jgi:transposase, IS5 family